MNEQKKGIWFPIILVMLIVVIALWFPFKYGNIFLYNHRLLKTGMVKNAQIIKKGILVNDKLMWVQQTNPSENHQFQVNFFSGDSDKNICQFGVSKSLYDNNSLGESISVTFLSDNPQKCKLSSSISWVQSILSFGLGLSGFMLFFALASIFFIHRSYNKPGPGNSDKLTTKMELEDKSVHCPKCNVKMTEGYLPMGLGIHWRNIDQPVGIPTIFNVLPNTVLRFKRQKLHAYHCKKCKIVTFKYGKKSN